jgi:hypothetical protein
MKKLQELKAKIDQAEQDMTVELKRRWPENSRIYVYLHARQKIATSGIVVGYSRGGYVGVRLDSAKEGSRRPCRDVFFKDIHGVANIN